MGELLSISSVSRLFEEGKTARREQILDCPYKQDTSDFYWWSKGWLEEHTDLEGGESNG